MRTEDLEYSMALVSKAAAGFERTSASFGGSSVGEMLSNSIIGYRQRPFSERKSQPMWLVFFFATKYLLIQVGTLCFRHKAPAGLID